MISAMRMHVFESEIEFEEPIERVFEFFSRAENLEELTPSWLNFRFLTPLPIEMRRGAEIEYRLRLHGIPVRWKTEIALWDPPHAFEDVQRRGPFRQWAHRHSFESRDGGTLMRDRVDYAVPGWFIEPLLHGLFVRHSVEKIFAFRAERFAEIFTVRTHKSAQK